MPAQISMAAGGAYNNNCRAFKVSYNRPFNTGTFNGWTWIFSEEYPMVRWFEANGYDVSYSTGVDTDRSGPLITRHKVFMSVGHDKYWSGVQRANVEAARQCFPHENQFRKLLGGRGVQHESALS